MVLTTLPATFCTSHGFQMVFKGSHMGMHYTTVARISLPTLVRGTPDHHCHPFIQQKVWVQKHPSYKIVHLRKVHLLSSTGDNKFLGSDLPSISNSSYFFQNKFQIVSLFISKFTPNFSHLGQECRCQSNSCFRT